MTKRGSARRLETLPGGAARPEDRLPGLDGLRAVAVVAVVLFHLNLPGLLPAGFLGVDLFFTLSGFIITALLLREHARQGRIDWLAFWGRRARRLLPPTLVMIAVSVPVTAVVAPEAMARLWSDLPAALLYVSNWWQIHSQQSYFETFGRPPVLQHLWSLAIEEQYYLLWPLLLAVVLRRRGSSTLAVVCTLAALASTGWMAHLYQGLAEGGDPSRVYLGSDTHVMGLFVGAALACIFDPWKAAAAATTPVRPGPVLPHGVGLAMLLAVLLAMQWLHEASAALFQGGFLVLAVATSLLIVASLQPGTWLARGLRTPIVQWLGTRSFSLYLWHWPVVVWLWPEPGATTLATVVNTLARVLIAGAAAELSYRLVERGAPWRREAGAGIEPWWRTRPLWIRGAVAATLSACALVLGYGVAPGDAAASASPPHADGPTASTADTPMTSPSAALTPATALTAGPRPHAAVIAAGHAAPTSVRTAAPIDARVTAPALGAEAEPRVAGTPPPEGGATTAATSALSARGPGAAAEPAAQGCVHIVGDSVVLGARPQLQRTIAGSVVDAEVGRQGHQAQQVLRQMLADRRLCPNVVLHVGTNGYLHEARYRELVGALAARGRVVLVNIRADRRWTAPNNTLIARTARELPEVRLVDWSAASDQRTDYFVQDGIHLTVAGMGVFAEHIRAALAGTWPAAAPAPLLASAPPAADPGPHASPAPAWPAPTQAAPLPSAPETDAP